MKFSYAVKFIQQKVKESLNSPIIPVAASREKLRDKLGETFDKEKCESIVDEIIKTYKTDSTVADLTLSTNTGESKMTVSEDNENIRGEYSLHPESTALTFTNDFEKAGIVKSELGKSGIVLSNIESLNIAESMQSNYDSLAQMVLQATQLYKDMIVAKTNKTKQDIQDTLDNIKDIEVSGNIDAMVAIQRHGQQMKEYREANVEQFKTALEKGLGIKL
jgi:hypothetical protein